MICLLTSPLCWHFQTPSTLALSFLTHYLLSLTFAVCPPFNLGNTENTGLKNSKMKTALWMLLPLFCQPTCLASRLCSHCCSASLISIFKLYSQMLLMILTVISSFAQFPFFFIFLRLFDNLFSKYLLNTVNLKSKTVSYFASQNVFIWV